MKEKIYTIPISDAFAADSICPFCTIKKNIEAQYVESAVGASMMEPDIRIKTNSAGFCTVHFQMMQQQGKALPLALVMQSHLREIIDTIFCELPNSTRTIFKSKTASPQEELSARIDNHLHSCYICGRIEETMSKFIDNTIYMCDSEPDFAAVFNNKPSFCMEHFSLLVKASDKILSAKKSAEFLELITVKQKAAFEKLYEDVTTFANSFDYRNSDPLTQDEKTAVKKAIELL